LPKKPRPRKKKDDKGKKRKKKRILREGKVDDVKISRFNVLSN
jgi:hypothetical protein